MNSTIACLGLEVLLQNQQTSYKIIQKKNKVKKKKIHVQKDGVGAQNHKASPVKTTYLADHFTCSY